MAGLSLAGLLLPTQTELGLCPARSKHGSAGAIPLVGVNVWECWRPRWWEQPGEAEMGGEMLRQGWFSHLKSLSFTNSSDTELQVDRRM